MSKGRARGTSPRRGGAKPSGTASRTAPAAAGDGDSGQASDPRDVSEALRRPLAALREAYRSLRDEAELRAERLPAHWALLDDLTGVAAAHASVGVIVVGLRGLEDVEVAHGWQAADEVLAAATRVLREHARAQLPAGTVVAPQGLFGEDLAVFVPRADGATPEALGELGGIADALERAVSDGLRSERTIEGWDLRVASGYAFLTPTTQVRIERQAGRALSRAHSMLASADQRLRVRLDMELRRLLERRGLRVAFQPIIRLADFVVVGHEALCRGPRGTPFEVADAMFAASYDFGLASELDALCRAAVLASASEIRNGQALFLNVLPEALLDGSLVAGALVQSLASVGLEPDRIVLEIAERGHVRDYAQFRERVRPFRDAGMRVALDDIGTGYSSLRLVPELQPDFLKVDIALIKEIDREPVKQGVLGTIVDLAARLRAEVICEGIETEAELRAVIAHGARYGQGFLLMAPTATPVSAVRRPSGFEPDGA